MEVGSNTPQKHDIIAGSPLAVALEDIGQTGEAMEARKRQEELNEALTAATGSALQGDYFDN